MVVSWFSAGVSSAVATKLVIDQVDKIIYTHIEDQHPDTKRFVKECEEWFGKEVEILQSHLMSVSNVARSVQYINGPAGAPCTRLLKRRVRKEWEMENDGEELTYVWGMDASEEHRCDRLRQSMPEQSHIFPLVDLGYHKDEAHRILKASGIARPQMYDLGYMNNNCIGCVKGGMGYWNKIRKDFPDVFADRAKMEREIGASCIKGVFLDELPEDAGRDQQPIVDDCGIFCEIMGLE